MTKQEAIKYGKAQLDIFGGKHAEFIRLALKVLENKNKGWTLTSERLPKDEEKVLYVTKDNMIYSGVYYDENSVNVEWSKFEDVFDKDNDVIAWQPYDSETNK